MGNRRSIWSSTSSFSLLIAWGLVVPGLVVFARPLSSPFLTSPRDSSSIQVAEDVSKSRIQRSPQYDIATDYGAGDYGGVAGLGEGPGNVDYVAGLQVAAYDDPDDEEEPRGGDSRIDDDDQDPVVVIQQEPPSDRVVNDADDDSSQQQSIEDSEEDRRSWFEENSDEFYRSNSGSPGGGGGFPAARVPAGPRYGGGYPGGFPGGGGLPLPLFAPLPVGPALGPVVPQRPPVLIGPGGAPLAGQPARNQSVLPDSGPNNTSTTPPSVNQHEQRKMVNAYPSGAEGDKRPPPSSGRAGGANYVGAGIPRTVSILAGLDELASRIPPSAGEYAGQQQLPLTMPLKGLGDERQNDYNSYMAASLH